jgi:hypothetical protein
VESQFNPWINPCADARTLGGTDDPPMNISDYLIDSVLVLLVLIQIKERPMTRKALIRPLVILSIAVVNYLHGIPTHGNDLVLVGVLALVGGLIGVASGTTAIFARRSDGVITLRSGWLSGFFWVLGMGSRFAFAYWASHSGAGQIASFSATHHITSAEAWTVALLAMAAFEVCGRTLTLARRWHNIQSLAAAPTPALATDYVLPVAAVKSPSGI